MSNFKIFKGLVFVDRLVFVHYPTKEILRSKKRVAQLEQGFVTYKHTKPDLVDNLPKLLFDSMSGLVYQDDALIAFTGKCAKVWGFNPRVEITLRGSIDKRKGFEMFNLDDF